jgi:hypothetical protein
LIQSIPLIADASSAKGRKRIKQCNSRLKIRIILVAIKKSKMLCTCVLKPIFEGKYSNYCIYEKLQFVYLTHYSYIEINQLNITIKNEKNKTVFHFLTVITVATITQNFMDKCTT